MKRWPAETCEHSQGAHGAFFEYIVCGAAAIIPSDCRLGSHSVPSAGIGCSPKLNDIAPTTREINLQSSSSMFARVRNRHERNSSGATSATNAPPLVSPLQMTFDFELPRPNSGSQSPYRISGDSLRPRTSDGLGGVVVSNRKSTVGAAPPLLPPIPRVASRHESLASSVSQESRQPDAAGKSRAREASDNVSTHSAGSRKSQSKPWSLNFEHPIDLMPVSLPGSPGMSKAMAPEPRFSTSSNSTPKMESSLFPKMESSPVLPLINSGPPMSRAFIDSRDKPYSHPSARPTQGMQQSQSMPYMGDSPNMLSLQSPVSYGAHSPLTPFMPTPASHSSLSPQIQRPSSSSSSLRAPKISGARLSPNASVEDLRLLHRAPTNGSVAASSIYRSPTTSTTAAEEPRTLRRAPTSGTVATTNTIAPTSYSGSTARPSTHSSATKAHSPSAHSPLANTIGTPYGQTSSSFPLPQHVSTRPKTAGATATVAGVSVPTHHTSTPRPESGSGSASAKADKRKTRLLNPMALLARRKSGQENEVTVAERSVAAQAYARQKSVAAVGVRNLPEDFDPRIRGKVVHDFSAPRPRRNFSYNDVDARSPEERQLQSSSTMPIFQQDYSSYEQQPSTQSKHTSDSSSARRSAHSPMFRELLSDDDDSAKRVSSLNAERLENKGFLQRVSHHSSNVSQESAVLPPFARRSQPLDPTQASFFRDDESKRSSDPSSGKERDSTLGSISEVSPVTAWSSNAHHVELRDSLGQSLSPVSPASPDKGYRPISAVSDIPITAAPTSPEARARSPSEVTARPYSTMLSQPAISSIAEHPVPMTKERSPNRNSESAPEAVMIPQRDSSLAPEVASPFRLSIPIPDRGSSLVTPELTPEIVQAESVPLAAIKAQQSPPKLVEKRASAVGHSRKMSGISKHRVSNASRFSFQFNDSAAEEQLLEDKHRKIKGQSAELERQAGLEDDEDDFDESAMDDMDELEVQQQQRGEAVQAPAPSLLNLRQARQQLQAADSDSDGSVYDEDEVPDVVDDREMTYAEHPAFRAHSAMASAHSRGVSQQTNNWRESGMDYYMQHASPESARHTGRKTSNASALTTGSKGPAAAVGGNTAGFVQDGLSPNESVPAAFGGARPRSGFYMQPKAAGYSPTGSPKTEKPPLPHRDSGNSERNRVASGMSASSPAKHDRVMSGATVASNISPRFDQQRVTSQSTLGGSSSSEPRTVSTGLGLSGFSDFRFSDTPDLRINGSSRPMSGEAGEKQGYANRLTMDSETMPQRVSGWAELQKHASMATPPLSQRTTMSPGYLSSPENSHTAPYRGNIGKNIRARNAAVNQNLQYADSDSGDEAGDDMYFDDGGFEQDIKQPHDHQGGLNEDAFDNDAFLSRVNRLGGYMGHQRDTSAMSGDGPYPSFAMGANPVKTRARQSQMLLEDLPLLQGPVDPKLIPQRNPSEDAKRLGLSSKVPPLPAPEGSKEAMMRMQSNLQAYHSALAEAANKAAAEGRFLRQPSVSSVAPTARSLSVYSKVVDDDKSHNSRDDRSHYSQEDNAGEEGLKVQEGNDGLSRNASKETSGSRMESSISYSPPKIDFDFGFTALSDDTGPVDDDLGLDDDIVAAANGEALASDDEGFYGQEFGFYAKARPNSGEAQAINGGYFGLDGDDGLARNKSLKEPNLTPITERSEFSTRNSFINLGHGAAFGALPSAGLGPASPALARMPVSPLVEGEVTSFDQLRKLRANAFGGSNGSLRSDNGPVRNSGGSHGWQMPAAQSPAQSTRSAAAAQGYFGPMGGAPMSFGYSTESSGSSNPSSAYPHGQHDSPQRFQFHDSPQSARSSGGALPFAAAVDSEATPRKGAGAQVAVGEPGTAKKVPGPAAPFANGQGHSRKGSDSVAYVRESDPPGGGQPRWVLERRRTSEQGQLELVGREVVQGGWI